MRLSQVVTAGVAATALMLVSSPAFAAGKSGASNGAIVGQPVRKGGLNKKRSSGFASGMVLGVLGAVGGGAAAVASSGGSGASPVSP